MTYLGLLYDRRLPSHPLCGLMFATHMFFHNTHAERASERFMQVRKHAQPTSDGSGSITTAVNFSRVLHRARMRRVRCNAEMLESPTRADIEGVVNAMFPVRTCRMTCPATARCRRWIPRLAPSRG